MTDKEVMQMAMDALERALSDDQPYIVSCKQTVEALRAALAQPEPVLEDIEQYRLQMAAISTAAIGYWKQGNGIRPEYDTLALRDVTTLYEKYAALHKTQPEPEPVAWFEQGGSGEWFLAYGFNPKANTKPLYTAPPQREWQGLTDEEVMSLLPGAVRLPPGWADTVRAIEAKLKDKNG